jgi:hypothetical protein
MVVVVPEAGVAPNVKVVALPATALALAAIDTTGTGRAARGTVTEPVIDACEVSLEVPGEEPVVAVTTADVDVVNVVWAMPFMSVFTFAGTTLPPVVVNPTGMVFSGLPAASVTTAVIVLVPPPYGTDAGLAVNATRPTAAVPTERLTALARTLPELALITAVPVAEPAENTAVA